MNFNFTLSTLVSPVISCGTYYILKSLGGKIYQKTGLSLSYHTPRFIRDFFSTDHRNKNCLYPIWYPGFAGLEVPIGFIERRLNKKIAVCFAAPIAEEIAFKIFYDLILKSFEVIIADDKFDPYLKITALTIRAFAFSYTHGMTQHGRDLGLVGSGFVFGKISNEDGLLPAIYTHIVNNILMYVKTYTFH